MLNLQFQVFFHSTVYQKHFPILKTFSKNNYNDYIIFHPLTIPGNLPVPTVKFLSPFQSSTITINVTVILPAHVFPGQVPISGIPGF